MTRRFPPGRDAWPVAICLSGVGVFMVDIAYAAMMPVLQREWAMSASPWPRRSCCIGDRTRARCGDAVSVRAMTVVDRGGHGRLSSNDDER